MDKPGQTFESLVCIHLQEIFFLLSQTTVRDWIDRFAVRNGVGKHLPYALALEIHISIIQLVSFATMPEWLRKAHDQRSPKHSAWTPVVQQAKSLFALYPQGRQLSPRTQLP
jgi:hypothetical protein